MDKEEKSFWKKVYLVYGQYNMTRYCLDGGLWVEGAMKDYRIQTLIWEKYILPRKIGIATTQYDFTDKFIKDIVNVE